MKTIRMLQCGVATAAALAFSGPVLADGMPSGPARYFAPTYNYVGDGITTVTSSTTSTCTVSGGTVSLVGTGICTLTANATAGTNYEAAAGTAQSFTIQ